MCEGYCFQAVHFFAVLFHRPTVFHVLTILVRMEETVPTVPAVLDITVVVHRVTLELTAHCQSAAAPTTLVKMAVSVRPNALAQSLKRTAPARGQVISPLLL